MDKLAGSKSHQSGSNEAYGHRGVLVEGDKVLCLHNNADVGAMNGEVFDVLKVEPCRPGPMLELTLQGRSRPFLVRIDPNMLGGRVSEFIRRKRHLVNRDESFKDLLHVDYGFALTVHKSQGSEWKHVGFLADRGYRFACNQDYALAARLAYTALTRARESVYIFGQL